MSVPRFELDRWLHEYDNATIEHNFAGSAGPVWTVRQILELDGLDPAVALDTQVRYSSAFGVDALRAPIAEFAGASDQDVYVTTGASEALTIIVAAHARRGANVLVPSPGYPPFAYLPQVFGMETRTYELAPERDFQLDVDEVLAGVDENTVVVIINTPHNPSGATIPRADAVALGAELSRRGVTLVVDQVFHPTYHGTESWLGTEVPDAVVVGDMSKALSMPGLRVGWIVDRDAGRRESYFDLRAMFTLSSPPLAERLASIALRHRDVVIARTRASASTNLAALSALLDRQADRVGWVAPGGGHTVFPWLTQVEDATPFCRTLADAGVLIMPGDRLGYPRHWRLGYAEASAEAFGRALEVIERTLEAI